MEAAVIANGVGLDFAAVAIELMRDGPKLIPPPVHRAASLRLLPLLPSRLGRISSRVRPIARDRLVERHTFMLLRRLEGSA